MYVLMIFKDPDSSFVQTTVLVFMLTLGHSVVQKRDLLKRSKTLRVCIFFQRRPIRQMIGRSEKKDSDFYHSPSVLVYAFHLAFMTVFGFTSMHVQVSVNKF